MNPPVTYSVDGDGIGWIVFDDPTARANVFNAATQTALRAALDALAVESGLRAAVILSAKERIFIAGADLKALGALPDPAAAEEYSRAGQALFQQVAAFKVPVIAAIHGACAGGGYELALACHGRIASDAAETQVGLPEVGLGTIPGWGGCARLPRLIGVRAALEHILKAQLVPVAEALKARLVDEVAPVAELKAAARAAALRLAEHGVPARPKPPVVEAGFFSKLRETTLARTRGHVPAPLRAIDVVERGAGLPLEEALALEAAAFGEVTAGEACKNLVRVFFLKDAAKKTTLDAWFPAVTAPVAAPVPRQVGVVGAGVMGSGIAQWLAVHGCGVVLCDVGAAELRRGVEVIRGLSDDAVRRGRLTAAAAHRALGGIATATDFGELAGCEFVIEAIVENVAVKQELFAKLECAVGPDAVLASNTSALPIEEIAAKLARPERALGLHFFNPAGRMPLVELVLGRATARPAAERALALARTLGKTPVVCRSAPGFLVTRVLFFYLNEAALLWEQGVPAEAMDAALRDFGWPMGPMRLIDEVGVDVTDFIFGELAHYYPDRFQGASVCARMNAAGLKGRKNGASRGFYTYEGGAEAANPELTRFAAAKDAAAGTGAAAVADHLADHLMGVMIDEAKRCLDEGVVRGPDDVDFALLSGAGFPAFRGGLMRHAKSLGLAWARGRPVPASRGFNDGARHG